MHSQLNAPVFQSPDGERSATWLELFFDLVFVVTVAALAHLLEEDFTWTGIGTVALIFLPIWWSWMELSYYGDLFDDNSVSYQWLMVLAMLVVAQLAITLRADGLRATDQVTLVFMALIFVSWVMYLRAYLLYPDLRWFIRRFWGAISLSLGIWALSLFVPHPWQYVCWVVATLVQALAGPTIYLTRKDYPVQLSHMPERFGLFSIIVLGEGMVALTAVSEAEAFAWDIAWTELGAFALVVCLWKLYFYESSKDTITEQLRSDTQRSTWHSFYYGYSHYFLYLAIILISVSLLMLIETSFGHTHGGHGGNFDHHGLELMSAQGLHAGAILFLATITLIHWAAPESLFPRVVAARLICIGLSVGLLLLPLAPLLELWMQVGTFSGLILVEYLIYRSHHALPTQDEAAIVEGA